MRFVVVAVAGVVMIGACSACGSSADDAHETGAVEMVESGSWYVRVPWPHDGRPVESERFVVYSDAASPEARREVAEVAEDVWSELLDEFSIEPSMLQYPEQQDRLDIYAYRNHNPQDWGGRAYYGGLIAWSPDHPGRSDDTGFVPMMKHELVHVLQWLINGPDNKPIDVWFIEGLPEYIAGGSAGGAIRGRDELNDLTAKYGAISPISYKTYSQITDADAGERFNYPMFQLAVEYLMDEDGYGRSPEDARDVLIDMTEGLSFATAFEDRMEVRLDEYEREFFDRMDSYLPRYRNPLFSPVGFALVSTLVIAFVIGAPAVGYRRWRLAAPARPVADEPRGRSARVGYVGGTTVASALIIVFFLSVLFAVGTTNELNNAVVSGVRFRVYWVLVAYLVASVGLVVWSVHRWIHRSRLAFLLAPLVIVATIITAFTIVAMF